MATCEKCGSEVEKTCPHGTCEGCNCEKCASESSDDKKGE